MARGAPPKDHLPVLADVLATWRTLGGPERCPFGDAVRATVTDAYATRRRMTSKALRAAVYRMVPSELTPMTYWIMESTTAEGALRLLESVNGNKEQERLFLQADPWMRRDMGRAERLHRLALFYQALPDLFPPDTPMSHIARAYDQCHARLLRKRNSRPNN